MYVNWICYDSDYNILSEQRNTCSSGPRNERTDEYRDERIGHTHKWTNGKYAGELIKTNLNTLAEDRANNHSLVE